MGEDAALRCLLLDRQRPRGANALYVRRQPARSQRGRRWRELRARPWRQSFALQLLFQSKQRGCDCTCAAARQAGRFRQHRPTFLGRQERRRHTRGARRGPFTWWRWRCACGRAPSGICAARHPGQQPQAGWQAHLARLSLREWPQAPGLGSRHRFTGGARWPHRQRVRRSH